MDKKLKKFLNWYKKKKDDEAFITPKDAYKRAWTCRDFELSHLWQRSVFLAVFLIAIAGAYGTLLMNMYFHSDQNYVYEIHAALLTKAQRQADQPYQKRGHPGYDALPDYHEYRGLSAQLPLYGGYGRNAGRIEQAERQQRCCRKR